MGKPKLLVVDDSKTILKVMQSQLKKLGYEVLTAPDAYTGMKILESEVIDLAILDVVMPGMSGLDLLRVIRQAFSRTELPIIMASSLTESADIVGGIRLGANDYVTKPVDFPVLNVRIETQLAMRELRPGDSRPTRDTRVYAKTLGPGSVINDRYEVIEVTGEGGFAIVYKARQTSTGQEVAIKILRHEVMARGDAATEAARFKQEMQVIGRLRHPNIVHLVDCGLLGDGQLFTVLEFIEGVPLSRLIRGEEGLRPNEVKHLMLQVLDALSCAHVRGVVHRDLKPQNVMIDTTGVRRNALVLDFGISSIVAAEPSNESSDTLTGSPAYMAPELLRGTQATVQSDIYAWGLILLECLTGSVAVRCESVPATVLAQLDAREIPIPDWIDPALRAVLSRAITKSCDDRYPSVMEALADLEAVQLGPDGDQRPQAHTLGTSWLDFVTEPEDETLKCEVVVEADDRPQE
jgi:DNA-binding response OmpR family regulator